ncbi:hypothetical protein NL676_035679 [Syzygium grande]|nr:hypothetical protein NL676_035679 [Syzygium grande]
MVILSSPPPSSFHVRRKHGASSTRYSSTVWVDEGELYWKPYLYIAWTYRDGLEETGSLRSFDIPFYNVSEWDPSAIVPPNGEIVDPEEPDEKSFTVPLVEPQAVQPLQAVPPYRDPRNPPGYEPEDSGEEWEEGDP